MPARSRSEATLRTPSGVICGSPTRPMGRPPKKKSFTSAPRFRETVKVWLTFFRILADSSILNDLSKSCGVNDSLVKKSKSTDERCPKRNARAVPPHKVLWHLLQFRPQLLLRERQYVQVRLEWLHLNF